MVTNLWDGLLSFDCYGKVVPAIASSWEHNEDATVWTFHLRDDVDWVDCNGEVKAHLTSKDFLVGFEWVMNAIKNEANNTSMPNDTIVGAYEYYQLTKEAGDAAADMTYEDMLAAGVGIEAPDDYTLVFTCPNACPYFDTVAAYTQLLPRGSRSDRGAGYRWLPWLRQHHHVVQRTLYGGGVHPGQHQELHPQPQLLRCCQRQPL